MSVKSVLHRLARLIVWIDWFGHDLKQLNFDRASKLVKREKATIDYVEYIVLDSNGYVVHKYRDFAPTSNRHIPPKVYK